MAKKKEEIKEDVKQETTALVTKDEATQLAKYGGLMDEMPVEASDLMLSKMLAMQGLSKLIQEEKAKLGDIRDSVTGGLITPKNTPVEVILFKPFKTWIVFQVVDKKEQFKSVEPYNSDTAGLERNEVVDGTEIVRYLSLNYYTLLPSEIKTGDYRPRLLSLRSTNYKIGKKIETTRAFLAKAGLPLPFKTFNLCTVQQSNEKGSWYIFDVTEGRKSEDFELDAVTEWVDIISKSDVKIDHSDLESEETPASHAAGEVKDTDKF